MFNARAREITVLLVDDHADMRKSIREVLQDNGMQIVGEAADGREAIRQCERLRPDIIVLDISMPVLNGFEAARQIAKSCPHTKIIFLTVHVLKEYAEEARRAGGAGFVNKQHAAYDLLAAIEAVLEGKTYISGKLAA